MPTREYSAVDLCGGADCLRKGILDHLDRTAGELGLTRRDVSSMVSHYDPGLLDRLVGSPELLKGDVALTMMTALGIAIEDVVRPRGLDAETDAYWRSKLVGGILANAGDRVEASADGLFGLLLRLQALKELD